MNKQGRADRSGQTSQPVTSPASHAVNPGAVSYLGNKMGNHTTDDGDFTLRPTPWNAGRGYHAPGIGTTTHGKGSQGKY